MQTTSMTTKSSSHHYSSEDENIGTTYRPKSTVKSVIIQRASSGGRSRGSNFMGGSLGGGYSSQRMSMNFNPAVFSQMAGTGIADFRGTREKEKKEMQDCNERLATYIEKVRWLEAQNKKLEAEVEALRNRKQHDWRPIREQYEGELKQAQVVIADLSTQKGVGEAKLAGLQDEIQSLKELISTYEVNAKDYCKKIDQLNSQIGEYEGELTTLRLRCGSLEDEVAKFRALVNKYKDENIRLRADLDAETAAHIEQEVLAQTKTEECEFLQDLLEKLQLMQQEPVTVKGMDMESFFKGELRQAVQCIQQAYDDKCIELTNDVEMKYAAQISQLKQGNVRDTMESEHAKTELKRLRDQMGERNARIAELESMLASIKADRDCISVQLNELQIELESLRTEMNRKLCDSQMQVEALLQQINELIDAKMSLELEIACYKKLLEGEENRTGLRQLVEQTIGIRSGGASQLSELIGQSSISMGGGFSSGSSGSSTARITVQRSSKGAIGFQTADPSGASITLENNSTGPRAVTQSLQGWKMVKKAPGREAVVVDLSKKELKPGQSLVLFAKGAKAVASSDSELIADAFSFGTGQSECFLLDESGNEKAKLVTKETL